MFARKLGSLFKKSPVSQVPSSAGNVDEGKSKSIVRRGVSFVLITVTGGVALSALDDLVIYRGCSRKAMEKASESKAIKDAIGDPIVKGPWYNASLAVSHRRNSVSCSFPVSGPQGNGVIRLKAVRDGDASWFSFTKPRNWNILVMDALLHVPTNDEKHQSLRISLSDDFLPASSIACTDCKIVNPENQENLQEKK